MTQQLMIAGPTPMAVTAYSLCTRQEFADDYRRAALTFGLDPTASGWGFLHCEDHDGAHWTRLTRDVDFLRFLVAANKLDLDGVAIPPGKFPLKRRGWPDEWVNEPSPVILLNEGGLRFVPTPWVEA